MNNDIPEALIKAILDFTNPPEPELPKNVDQGDPATRLKIAEFIAAHPKRYKICCGCEAVVKEPAAVCPQCLAYRFEDDEELVIAHAFCLAERVPTEWLT